VGGLSRIGSRPVAAQISAPPTVDRLVLTNVPARGGCRPGVHVGQIARLTDFEKPPPAARLRAGDAGSACSATHFGLVKVESKPGDLVADNFQGEHATAFLVKDRGLVVITSCGHAGVINSVRQVQKATDIEKVHAVVGGFHLAPAPGHQSRLHPGGAPGAPGQADHALHGHPGGLRSLAERRPDKI
jgi:hypothetical protein